MSEKVSLTKQYVGQLGERIAAKYLINKGYIVVDRNYRRVYGEIDIVAKKGDTLHFIEVKSVSRETFAWGGREFRPEENVHPWKLRKLGNTIQAYLASKYGDREVDWQFDVITVEIDFVQKRARCRYLKNIVL